MNSGTTKMPVGEAPGAEVVPNCGRALTAAAQRANLATEDIVEDIVLLIIKI